jgi:hypothetical protein
MNEKTKSGNEQNRGMTLVMAGVLAKHNRLANQILRFFSFIEDFA